MFAENIFCGKILNLFYQVFYTWQKSRKEQKKASYYVEA